MRRIEIIHFSDWHFWHGGYNKAVPRVGRKSRSGPRLRAWIHYISETDEGDEDEVGSVGERSAGLGAGGKPPAR